MEDMRWCRISTKSGENPRVKPGGFLTATQPNVVSRLAGSVGRFTYSKGQVVIFTEHVTSYTRGLSNCDLHLRRGCSLTYFLGISFLYPYC